MVLRVSQTPLIIIIIIIIIFIEMTFSYKIWFSKRIS